MQKSSLSEGQLIVVELGAEWPSAALAATPSTRRVLVQDESETPAAFAARLGEQLNELQARGVALGGAVLACSERLDSHAQTARAELARAVASALSRHQGGEFELVATDRNAGRSRPALANLVSDLSKEWQGARVVPVLRFGGERVEADQSRAEAEAKSRTGSRRSPGTKAGEDGQDAKNGSRRVA